MRPAAVLFLQTVAKSCLSFRLDCRQLPRIAVGFQYFIALRQ